MSDLLIGIIVLAILALAIGYIVRAKKSGVKCIGCSACSGHGKKTGCHCNDKH